AAWFKNPNDRGNEYPAYFNPITAVALALIFTIVEYCLEEWMDGVEKEGPPFTESSYEHKYDARLMDIEDWSNAHPEFFKNLGKKMKSGAVPLEQDTTNRLSAEALKQAKDALVGRTGNTDSEAESDGGSILSNNVSGRAIRAGGQHSDGSRAEGGEKGRSSDEELGDERGDGGEESGLDEDPVRQRGKHFRPQGHNSEDRQDDEGVSGEEEEEQQLRGHGQSGSRDEGDGFE
ncbi:hypothetical protein OF83DRAFT_1088820, partial [Amylostereum chailletii]